MASADQTLPEGTDHIIAGAGVTGADDEREELQAGRGDDHGRMDDAWRADREPAGGGDEDLRSALFGRFEALRGQANDRARDFVVAGKDRATGALDDLVAMIEDAAAEVDGKIGSYYGDYARSMADGIAGFSDSFKEKDVDQLFDEARELVRSSPRVAVGVAAALGFVVARVARSAVSEAPAADGRTPAAA